MNGYQHRSLKRDLNILLINCLDKKGSYKLFPFGNLREPLKNINRADIVIKTKSNLNLNNKSHLDQLIERINIDSYLCEFETYISNKFTNPKFIKTDLIRKRVLVVNGIGDPLSFTKSVSTMKCKIVKQLDFKDHFNYDQHIWDKIEELSLKLDVEFILTTEKDWIKN